MQVGMIKGLFHPNWALGKPRRFRNYVGIEGGPLNVSPARQKAAATDLVGVGFSSHAVGPRARWRATAGKARDRKIEAAPKKMYRAALANETRTKFFED